MNYNRMNYCGHRTRMTKRSLCRSRRSRLCPSRRKRYTNCPIRMYCSRNLSLKRTVRHNTHRNYRNNFRNRSSRNRCCLFCLRRCRYYFRNRNFRIGFRNLTYDRTINSKDRGSRRYNYYTFVHLSFIVSQTKVFPLVYIL